MHINWGIVLAIFIITAGIVGYHAVDSRIPQPTDPLAQQLRSASTVDVQHSLTKAYYADRARADSCKCR